LCVIPLTDKQTDQQVIKRQLSHNVLREGNNSCMDVSRWWRAC